MAVNAKIVAELATIYRSQFKPMFELANVGWGARIRTWECRYQKPMPYHLATPQHRVRGSPCSKARPSGQWYYVGSTVAATQAR